MVLTHARQERPLLLLQELHHARVPRARGSGARQHRAQNRIAGARDQGVQARGGDFLQGPATVGEGGCRLF